jgi:hypothetical protein
MMKNKQRWIKLLTLSFLFFVLQVFLSSCEKQMTQPELEENQLSQATSEGLVNGWQTVHTISTAGDLSSVIKKELPLEKNEQDGLYSTQQLNLDIEKIEHSYVPVLKQQSLSSSRSVDSLLWFIDWSDPISGVSVRKALYYDSNTGKARYYEAIYQFPNHLQLKYDSTEIRANLNYTLADSTDDKVLSLYKHSIYREGFDIEKSTTYAVVTNYDFQNKVNGAVLENTVWYSMNNEIEKLFQKLELNPDESGSVNEKIDYRDGSSKQKQINFYSNYTGDFSETWRDGTKVSGTFDRIEDDNHASFSRVVNYPKGNDPIKLTQSADVTLNPADSSSIVELKEKIQFADGKIDTTRILLEEFYQESLKHNHFIVSKSDGSKADLNVVHHENYQEISGNFIGEKDYFTLINATLYNDGSGDIHLEVYLSEESYINGESPLAIIDLHFNPDGSGRGSVSENNNQYQVQMKSSGLIVVSDQEGKHHKLNGFQ